MKKTFIYMLLCGMIVGSIACKKDDGGTYPPPQTTVGAGGSSTTDTGGAGGSTVNYSDLCEQSSGDLVVTLCCQMDHPFKVDTCKGEEECPQGGVTCVNVVVCECGENMCFSLEEGCLPIQ